MMRRRWHVAAAAAGLCALVAGACGDDDDDSGAGGAAGELAGQTVAVAAVWSGTEQESFEAVLDAFEEETGATVQYQSTGDDIAAVLGTALEGGSPPDVAVLPNPGLLRDLAGAGNLIAVDGIAGDVVDANYAPVWRELGSVDGTLYGVWFKAANKSTVWYDPAPLRDAGLEPPADWDAFEAAAQTLLDSGVIPLSVGGADGWTLTDWFENVYLRTAGAQLYDRLARHEIPWTDPSVITALHTMGRVLGRAEFIAGGPTGALQTDFPGSVTKVFVDPAEAAIVYEGDFVAGVIQDETDAVLGEDADFFPFPAIDGSAPAVVGGGDVAVMLADNEASRALLTFLGSGEAAEVWAERGGFTSPNQQVDPAVYPDDITRRSAEALVDAETFRFDLSDLQPAAFGGTPGQGLFKLFQDWLARPGDSGAIAGQMEAAAAAAFSSSDGRSAVRTGGRRGWRDAGLGMAFLAPAVVVLGGLVVYPVLYTVVRSLFGVRGFDSFVGLENYGAMFAADSTRTAIKNNFIWVVTAPVLATALGLVFAVLTERMRFGTAAKLIIFMPMAISFLAAGVIFRFVYESSPERGLLNAMARVVTDVFRSEGPYPGARPVDEDFKPVADGFATGASYGPGDVAGVGLVGFPPGRVPDDAAPAGPAARVAGGLTGVVWLDFTPGGGGTRGVIDEGELGLPGLSVEAVDAGGDVVARATADASGRFVLSGVAEDGLALRLPAGNFRAPWPGHDFLGPALVTPAIIGSFLWIWAGFAMMLIAAGLAAIPREMMEAARVDGAGEWAVFRRVTVPLLSPVLLVVAVTLVINVLKIFDLVLVIPPGSVQDEANVIALELWRVSFGGARDQGLGSALGVLLFVLVLPAMVFNIRRFRSKEGS